MAVFVKSHSRTRTERKPTVHMLRSFQVVNS